VRHIALIVGIVLASSGAVAQSYYSQDGQVCAPQWGSVLGDICMRLPLEHWHLLTVTNGGAVSMIKNLTKQECDHLYRVLMGPSDDAYRAYMDRTWAELKRVKEWQLAHPQCKHVEWWWGSSDTGPKTGSVEDLSGKWNGKDGWCSVDGQSELVRGTEDDLTTWSPDTNPLIEKNARRAAAEKAAPIKSVECFE
jgi:hypothetical protein